MKKILKVLGLVFIIITLQNCADYSKVETEMIDEELHPSDSQFFSAKSRKSKFNTKGLNFSTPRGSLQTTSGNVRRTSSGLFLVSSSSQMRALDNSSDGDIGHLRFRFRGRSKKVSRLSSGKIRSQFGLKLKSPNGCNVLYVMWKIYPTEKISVSLKENKGKTSHSQCGARGYRSLASFSVPKGLTARTKKTRYLSAEIVDEKYLDLYLNKKFFKSIKLDSQTRRYLRRHRRNGHTGIRSDNSNLIFKFKVQR